MADRKSDPTIRSASPKRAEGTHDAVPVEEGADAAVGKKYADNPDKPSPSTVAQVEVTDE